MSRLKSILIALLLVTSFSVSGQDAKRKWGEADPIQWSNFKGTIDPNSNFAAVTFSGISYKWNAHTQQGQVTATFTTASFMDESKSWTKPNLQTEALLKHERLHFDISEFFSRKLLSSFNAYPYTTDYRTEITRIYEDLNIARKAMEIKYDEQSNHSKNKIKQIQWELYVSQLLTNNYSYEEALRLEPVD